jgi:hypothetical protein
MRKVLPEVQIHEDIREWVSDCSVDEEAIVDRLRDNNVESEKIAALRIEIGRTAIISSVDDGITFGEYEPKKGEVHVYQHFKLVEQWTGDRDVGYQQKKMNSTLTHELQHVINWQDPHMLRKLKRYKCKQAGINAAELGSPMIIPGASAAMVPAIQPEGLKVIDGMMSLQPDALAHAAAQGGVTLALMYAAMYAIGNSKVFENKRYKRYLNNPDEISAREAEERHFYEFIHLKE